MWAFGKGVGVFGLWDCFVSCCWSDDECMIKMMSMMLMKKNSSHSYNMMMKNKKKMKMMRRLADKVKIHVDVAIDFQG